LVCKFFDKFMLGDFWVIIDFNYIVHSMVVLIHFSSTRGCRWHES